MKLLCVHPGPLMYTRVFLRLEPLGLELVAAAARDAGHEVRIIDLQVATHRDYCRQLDRFRPDAVCFSGNYLANVPEIIDLSRETRAQYPGTFIFVGGHSVSFIARDILAHAEGAIDCVLKGEGEATVADLLAASRDGGIARVAGAVTAEGEGPPPRFVERLDALRPARDLLPH
ncbi:MAG TPA: cobalamin B12-binding domain-containing protein, partial [Acetobacteraceae bacterium]|nr:cobalamin B12-binding domain-containing protein [Acetobacteraceae bacterium]